MEGVFVADIDGMMEGHGNQEIFKEVVVDHYTISDREKNLYLLQFANGESTEIEAANASDACNQTGRNDIVRVMPSRFTHHVPLLHKDKMKESGIDICFDIPGEVEVEPHSETTFTVTFEAREHPSFEMLDYAKYGALQHAGSDTVAEPQTSEDKKNDASAERQ